MIRVMLSDLARALNGRLLGADCAIDAVSTDTRTISAGALFVALRGARFDAHEFAAAAVAAGASALLVERELALDCPQLVVADSRIALGQLGALVMAAVAPKTVAVTGSAGKTTVKEMMATILAQAGQVLATKGNFNNDIGVPLTLLRLTAADQYAVMELGANHRGEIAYTVDLVKPQAAIITNAAAAHLEGFGDIAGVARAKSEIFLGLPEDGVAIFPADSQFSDFWAQRNQGHRIWTFAIDDSRATFHAREVVMGDDGCARFTLCCPEGEAAIALPLPGRHNIANALAAAAGTLALGVSLAQLASGLAAAPAVAGRLNSYRLADDLLVIDDSYNANLQSVRAAIELLAGYGGQRLLVLGDMAELGDDARRYHAEVGAYAAERGIDQLLTCGELSRTAADAAAGRGCHFADQTALIAELKQQLDARSGRLTILVKGSRSARMEQVVNALRASHGAQTEGASC